MEFVLRSRPFLVGFPLAVLILAASGCQSGDAGGALGSAANQPPQEKVTEAELRAYCPQVVLREGTAFYSTYERGGDGDPAKLVYQASIADVTRSCTYGNGMLTMNVAVAGKVVPGPVGKAGTITMPIRVAVIRGDEVLYSQLHKFPVALNDTTGATQFIFNDPNVTFPQPTARNIRVFAGYDEGPPPATQ